MAQLRIRPLTATDIPHLIRYWRDGTPDFYRDMGIDPNLLPNEDDLQSFFNAELEASTPRYLVGTVNDRPVCCGLVSFSDKIDEPEFHFHIWSEADRKQGYGRHFSKKMLADFAGIYGLRSIYLQPSTENKTAISGLEKAGYRSDGLTQRQPSGFYLGGPSKRFTYEASYLKTLLGSIKSHLDLVILTMLAGYAGKTYQIIDQAYASRISGAHLEAHILISYIPFIIAFFAMILGYSLLVLLNKSKTQEERQGYLSGALKIALITGALAALGLLSAPSFFVSAMGLSSVQGANTYFQLQSLAAVLIGINTVYKYACIAQRKSKIFLVVDGVGTALNFLGNWLAVTFATSPESAFAGLAWTTLAVQVLAFTIYYANLKELRGKQQHSALAYWHRAKSLIRGDAASILLFMGIPIVYTILFKKMADDDLMSAYNVAYQVVAFITVPLFTINATGTAWLAAAWQFGSNRLWAIRLQSLLAIGLVFMVAPILLLFPFREEILWSAFQINGDMELWVVSVMVATLIPSTLLLPYSCAIRVFENPKFLAYSSFIGSYLFGVPAFILFATLSQLKMAVLVSQMGAVLIGCGMTLYFLKKLYRKYDVFK
jgi:Na+-driven multidrug efflux pump/RimJ/RimL family protein N-acetyltransferase